MKSRGRTSEGFHRENTSKLFGFWPPPRKTILTFGMVKSPGPNNDWVIVYQTPISMKKSG